MSGIFLSYSRADRPIAQTVAEALEAEGFTVWWDKILRAGQTYDEVTESMLRDSSVVVVLWSHTSVKSKWVRAEATLGQRNAVVVPAMIEDAERPIMFELTQSANLIGWTGDRSDSNWQDLVADIKRVIDPADASASTAATISPPTSDATIENTFWTSIQDTSDPAELEAYLKRYPDGHFSELARNRLNGLMSAAAPVVAAAALSEPSPKPVASPPAPEQVKKSGSKAPLLIVALLALGAVGYGAMQFLPSDDQELEPIEQVDAPPPPPLCDICPDMTEIPAGSFSIGSPDTEPGRIGNEGPQKRVSIAAFEMSTTEITVGEWAACVADGVCPTKRGGDTLPVGSVSWDEANTYTSWLSAKTNRSYRLPSEAEWEYAARANTESAYWWGDRFSDGQSVTGQAAPADAGPINPFGLIGMLGNVREWTQDCYVNNYSKLPTDGSAMRSASCDLRSIRGGSFKHGASEHRAANRARQAASTKDPAVGFRVVVPETSND
ncbi:MAG: SUMF1/EgtB/PvdO family nonheme iron enzyme [Pseudomonadota bacterium]